MRTTLLISLLTLLVAGCQPVMPETTAPAAEHAEAHPPHWGYEGENGPAHWGELDSSFAACAQGMEQSPVDIASPSAEDLANIVFTYQPSTLRVLNNGHTVQANYDAGSYMELDGHRYEVLQFHYHAPSEHTINGQSFPAEFHIVHKDAENKLAVIGLIVTPGAENAALAEMVANLPAEESPETVIAGATVDVAALLPVAQTTYRYPGSLTTPPCSEGVSWLVMTTPIELSASQIAAFEAVHVGNNRPLQPLHGRALVEDTTP